MTAIVKKVVYVAHRVGQEPQRSRNLEEANLWHSWLVRGCPGVAWVMPWWMDCHALLEEPEAREWGLARDVEVVRRCDALVMLGPVVSAGMALEASYAPRVYDLTGALEIAPDDGSWPWLARCSGFELLHGERRHGRRAVGSDEILGWLGDAIDGAATTIPYVRIERSWHGITRTVRRPSWACTTEELAKWDAPEDAPKS